MQIISSARQSENSHPIQNKEASRINRRGVWIVLFHRITAPPSHMVRNNLWKTGEKAGILLVFLGAPSLRRSLFFRRRVIPFPRDHAHVVLVGFEGDLAMWSIFIRLDETSRGALTGAPKEHHRARSLLVLNGSLDALPN